MTIAGAFGRGTSFRCIRFAACAKQEGKITVATIVDHVIPHKGDSVLFNDVRNWQPLCKAHHDRTKQRIDVHGFSTEVDPSTGLYRDPKHPSNAR